jgi:PAS domain S-box-containing protein
MTALEAPARILVVDDEPGVCELICSFLARKEYDCRAARNAYEAVELLRREEVEVVIADILMPGASGLDLLSSVRERFPKAAVVIITAVADRSLAVEALKMGARAVLTKPLDLRELEIQVDRAVEAVTGVSAPSALPSAGLSEALFACSPFGIVIVDQIGRLTTVNPAFSRMLGIEREAAVGKSLFAFGETDSPELERRWFHELLEGARSEYRVEKRFKTEAGEVRRVGMIVVAGPCGGAGRESAVGWVQELPSEPI